MGKHCEDWFRFADFLLDLSKGRLFKGTEDVSLRPKSLALLSHLVRHAGRVVLKDELIETLWPDVTVTEDSLTQCVRDVRRALGAEGASLLRTVPCRGYLFIVPEACNGQVAGVQPVTPAALAVPLVQAAPSPANPTPVLRPDGIAVLPFILESSGEPGDGHLIDGLVHDVISRLARLRSFHVIARGSSFALRPIASDPQAVGRALGVAYAVAGTAEMQDTQVRLRVELIKVADGSILWTEDLVETRDRFLSVLDWLTDRIVHSVQMQVTAAEARRALALPEPTLDAWEAYHRGLPDAYRFDPEAATRALAQFRRATALAPDFARAHAAQSFCHFYFAFSGMVGDRATEVAAARRTAENAMQADDSNPSSHWAFGRALWLQGDDEGCLQHARRAVALSPSFAHAHYTIGFVETQQGDAQHGLSQMDRALALSPFDPFTGSIQIMRAFALVRLDQIEEAADWARLAARQPNTYPAILAPAALIPAGAGRTDQARSVATKLREIAPAYSLAHFDQALERMNPDVSKLFRRNAATIGL